MCEGLCCVSWEEIRSKEKREEKGGGGDRVDEDAWEAHQEQWGDMV